MPKASDKRRRIIGEDLGIVCGTRYRNVCESRVNEVWMNLSVDVDDHAFRGEPLRAVAGDGVAMIEVTHLVRGERNSFPVVHADGELPVLDLLNGAKVAVGNAQLFGRGGKAQTVANRKLTL